MHALSLWQVITGRQTVIFTIATRFPHEETWDWTHTHSVTSCDDERRIRLQHDPVLSALYAIFWGFLASCFWTDLRLYSSSASCKRWYGYRFGSRSHHKDQFLRQCHLVTQASPEVKNFSAKTTALGCFPRLADVRQNKVQLITVLSASIAFNTVFLYYIRSPASTDAV